MDELGAPVGAARPGSTLSALNLVLTRHLLLPSGLCCCHRCCRVLIRPATGAGRSSQSPYALSRAPMPWLELQSLLQGSSMRCCGWRQPPPRKPLAL